MAMTNKQAIELVGHLIEYCKETKCKNCVFYLKNGGCYFRKDESLLYWELPVLSRWTKTDKALAEALKLAGVKKVYRNAERNCTVLTDDHFNMADVQGVLKAFKDLKPGEEITLDEIINSEGERKDY